MYELKTQAITLGYSNYREYDRILTLFSPEHGLITATAHAVRRIKSEIRMCADLFFFGEFVLKKNKKGYYSVKSIDMIDIFYDLRLDMNRLSCASYMCDFCKAVVFSEQPQHEIFILLLKALSLLCYEKLDYKNIKLKFEINAMKILGYDAVFEKCSLCGARITSFASFVNGAGGVVCRNCNMPNEGISISLQALATLNQLKNMPIDNISIVKITEKVYKDIEACFNKYIYWHLESSFKSSRFLEKFNID